jgi:N-acetyl-alpha-D-muramate 1-phosphate uridylyltransferase
LLSAIILAAGRGERMRPLTDSTPKALLEVAGKSLIEWHIEKLASAGFSRIVVNCAHLGARIESQLGTGVQFGVRIEYSREQPALETAGGIANALPMLDSTSFAAISADVFSDFDYAGLAATVQRIARTQTLGHLILVDNPAHHPGGDFALRDGAVVCDGERLTFSGMAAYRGEMFGDIARGAKAALGPLLRHYSALHRITGEHHRGRWFDIGTPDRLKSVIDALAAR